MNKSKLFTLLIGTLRLLILFNIFPFSLANNICLQTDSRYLSDPQIKPPNDCECNLKPCIKFCCHLTEILNENGDCVARNESEISSTLMNISTTQGEHEVNLVDQFTIQFGQPCKEAIYSLDRTLDVYELFENGTLFQNSDIMTKNEFCLNKFTESSISIMVCGIKVQKSIIKTFVHKFSLLFSVPFFLLTILVHKILPGRKSLHNNALCWYLCGLSVGYLILGVIALPVKFDALPCKLLGYTAYFWLMASFFWLSVISFNLYRTFRKSLEEHDQHLNKLYSFYAWGLAFLCLSLTFAADELSFVPNNWKPSIGKDRVCWLKTNIGWTAMLYFFGPIAVIIIFNSVMFILTALKIHNIKKEVNQQIHKTENGKNFLTFGIFLRLFIIMGVSWTTEICSYMFSSNSYLSNFFYVFDIINNFQGILVFAIFVLRRRIILPIIRRWRSNWQESNRTQSALNQLTMSTMVRR